VAHDITDEVYFHRFFSFSFFFIFFIFAHFFPPISWQLPSLPPHPNASPASEWKDGAFPTATIPPELLKVYEEERAYLAELARADRPPTKTLGSALSPLINVFGCEGGEGGILYERETPEELKIPKLMEQRRVREEEAGFDGQFATVTSHALFKERWDTITHGAFEGFNWENVYACGGSVLGCLLPQNVGFHHSDIDLFLCVETPEEADRALRNIVETITRNTAKITSKPVETFKTKRSISVRTGYRTYQIVTTLYRTLEDVIFAFDIDSCCVGYAGGPDVWITPRARRAIAKRYNLVHLTIPHAHALPGRYERRLFKYARRGFAIAVPGYDRSQIDPNVWLKHTFDASGLEKLLLLDKAVSDHPEMGDPKHFFVTDIDNCIHGGGSWCRVCHKEHSTVEETQSHVQEATINVTTTATANDPIEPSVYIPASTLSAPHQPAQFQPQLPAPTLSANSRLVNGTAPLTWERRHVVFQDLEVDRGKGTAYYTRNLEYVHLGWDDEVYRNEEYAPSSSTTSETERSTKHVLSTVHGYRATVCECGLPAGSSGKIAST
jgi:hypothetical protein